MHRTLIVVDNDALCGLLRDLDSDADQLPEVISFSQYLNDYPKRNEPKTRIINLCNTDRYLSKGYYCSLLAEARVHQILPSMHTINELRDQNWEGLADFEAFNIEWSGTEELVYFGHTENLLFETVASGLFKQFPAPLLRLSKNSEGLLRVQRYAFSKLNDSQIRIFYGHLVQFTQKFWRISTRKKRYRWDMAILIDPNEVVPPSNKEAIARFVKAASKLSIRAEVLSAQELPMINHYDALFLRETTAIDHHTYRLAAKAEKAGVLAIDDTTSILRCCNKVFLHDAFTYRGVPAPRTFVLEDNSETGLQKLEENLSYPIILKMPEGSFSRGVFKVANRQELESQIAILQNESALVLAQEFLYTEFDWRIGILNGRAIYASKYFMARNHWQIYNHQASKRFVSGGFETLPTFEVPRAVLNAALKAADIIGNGLYGVDVKFIDGKAYVLEVNDNPSIDHRVEDAYLGDELYMLIMAEFQRRLEIRGR